MRFRKAHLSCDEGKPAPTLDIRLVDGVELGALSRIELGAAWGEVNLDQRFHARGG
jgi:hypothetical protein